MLYRLNLFRNGVSSYKCSGQRIIKSNLLLISHGITSLSTIEIEGVNLIDHLNQSDK